MNLNMWKKKKIDKTKYTQISPTLYVAKGKSGNLTMRPSLGYGGGFNIKPEYIPELCKFIKDNFKEEIKEIPEFVELILKM